MNGGIADLIATPVPTGPTMRTPSHGQQADCQLKLEKSSTFTSRERVRMGSTATQPLREEELDVGEFVYTSCSFPERHRLRVKRTHN